jgi:hypothetical protein
MKTPLARITGLLILTLLLTAQVPAPAPSPNPEAATAARELMDTMKLTDQFKAILPTIFQQLKPAIVQNRPEVERDLDSFMPILADKMGSRLGELENAIALIYASNFTAAEADGVLQDVDRTEIPSEDADRHRANHGRRPEVRPVDGGGRAEADTGCLAQQGPPALGLPHPTRDRLLQG